MNLFRIILFGENFGEHLRNLYTGRCKISGEKGTSILGVPFTFIVSSKRGLPIVKRIGSNPFLVFQD